WPARRRSPSTPTSCRSARRWTTCGRRTPPGPTCTSRSWIPRCRTGRPVPAATDRPYTRRMSGARRPDGGWTFVSNHFLVLLCIAEDPGVRMAEVAGRLGLTERAVQGIVADLAEAGYLQRTRVGRRNRYDVDTSMPLRHLETQHR